MTISGQKVELRPARESDRKKIFIWLTRSDLTSSIMGPPDYPDFAIPTWEEFCAEYPLSYFNASGDGSGRNYIIVMNEEEIGTIGYDLLDRRKDRVVLDIWMRSDKDCGKGCGSDALTTLCGHLHRTYGVTTFMICPSARNKRAIAAYRKAGFEVIRLLDSGAQLKEFGRTEYDDNILMTKKVRPTDREE